MEEFGVLTNVPRCSAATRWRWSTTPRSSTSRPCTMLEMARKQLIPAAYRLHGRRWPAPPPPRPPAAEAISTQCRAASCWTQLDPVRRRDVRLPPTTCRRPRPTRSPPWTDESRQGPRLPRRGHPRHGPSLRASRRRRPRRSGRRGSTGRCRVTAACCFTLSKHIPGFHRHAEWLPL